MKDGTFDRLVFSLDSSNKDMEIKLLPLQGGDEEPQLFENQNGEIVILCQNIESLKSVRDVFLYAVKVLDLHINDKS